MDDERQVFLERLAGTAARFAHVTDFPAHRAKREALQQSALGRRFFGAVPDGVVEDEIVLAGRRALVHRPASAEHPRPTIVNVHGGGWVQGNPELSRWVASEVALRVGAVVVSPTYRLAPEHRFPAAVDDAWEALGWVRDHISDLGGDLDRLAVMGDSAGGNLAAVTALMARDSAHLTLRAQVLNYPVLDMDEIFPSEVEHAHAPALDSENMRALVRLYLGDRFGTDAVEASPLRAPSHAGLPPTLIVTADADILRDHGRTYAESLRRDGVDVTVSNHEGATHGFLAVPGLFPQAEVALAEIVEHLERHLTTREDR